MKPVEITPDLPARMGPLEVAYAVLCGCDTNHRLGIEWDIDFRLAAALLEGAVEAKLVVSLGDGSYISVVDADKACQ